MEKRRDKDDEVPRRIWKAVETKTVKVRIAKAEGERKEGRSGKETGRKRGKKKELS